jgi:radical SAM superfamily enzyme YgiQ (UPF0313 family)
VLCLYTMTCNAKRAYELADLFHEKGHARVIIGGMHASSEPEEALKHADQVVVGEGERIILDCVEGRITDPRSCTRSPLRPRPGALAGLLGAEDPVRGRQHHDQPRLPLPLQLLHHQPHVRTPTGSAA